MATALPEISAAWWRNEEEKANGNAAADAHLLLRRALKPLAQLTATLAQTEGAADRGATFARGLQQATGSCLLPFDSAAAVRAMVFVVADDKSAMVCKAHSGRSQDSAGFDTSSTRGKKAFRALKAAETVFEPDIRKTRGRQKRAWSGSGKGYDTFITVPITTGTSGYGLLSVDAPKADMFTRKDVLFVELIASMLAVLFAEATREPHGSGGGSGHGND